MAARAWDTSSILDRVKNITFMPTAQNVFTEARLVDMINEEMYAYITPFLLEAHEDYLLTYTDISLVASTAAYDLPTDALGDTLQDVKIRYADGREDNVPRRTTGMGDSMFARSTDVPTWFQIRGNQIIFPIPTTTLTDPVVRLYYHKRPAPLAVTTDYGLVSAIDTGAPTVTYASASGLNGDALVNVQRGDGLYDFRVESWSGSATSTVFTPDNTGEIESYSVAVGDYVVADGYAAVPQLPRELVPALCYRVGINILRARGLEQLAQQLELKAAQLEDKLRGMFRQRVVAEPPILFNPNSPLRLRNFNGYRRRR